MRMTQPLVIAAAGLSLLVGASGSPRDDRTGKTDPGACEALKTHSFGRNVRIEDATWIAATGAQPWSSPGGFRGPAVVKSPFCRVQGIATPTPQSSIRFEVWLPAPGAWNEKFFGTASGGSMGAIQYAALSAPVEGGFAAMAHDNGHQSTNIYEQNWAFDAEKGALRQELLIDFASRAQHVSTVAAKAVAHAYYRKAPQRAYYVACSQGGHHGLMEAERYPDDYDGIVAGAHGGDWTGMVGGQAWAAYLVTRQNRAGALSRTLAQAVSRRAISECDALDGLADGLIEDPRACRFDPAVMQCGREGADPAACLTPAQVEATRAIYGGSPGWQSGSGAPGFIPGSEQYWPWTDSLDPISGSYHDFYRLLLKNDPNWAFGQFDPEKDIEAGRRKLGAIMDANSADLSAFARRGGKLILYHGWSDPLISPYLSTNKWHALERQMGRDTLRSFARLFMIPGMAHCGDGPVGGTRDTHDPAWLTAIENWVEHGIAPDADSPRATVIGFGSDGDTLRTRPYCPYPKVARYVGTGGRDRAANYTCQTPD